MNSPDDTDLVFRLQKDDSNAFDTLYWKYHSAIYANVLKLTRDTVLAEDIVQEVFITLWERRMSLSADKVISGWLFVVSYNRTVNYLKEKLKKDIKQKDFVYTAPSLDNADADLVNTRWNILEKAIVQLSPQKRKVFDLCKMQGKSYDEAAKELNISKYTVKEYLSSAIAGIREYIRQHPEQDVLFIFTLIFIKCF